MDSLVLFVWFLGIILFWGTAFSKLSKQKDGIAFFFKHLLGLIAVLVLVCTPIFNAADNCQGFFCGLGYVLTALAIIGITTLVWPIILAFIIAERRKLQFAEKHKETLDDILDDNL